MTESLNSTPKTPRRKDFYLAYLNSSDWRTRRNRALRLANWRCEHCGEKRDLQVHHKTYERLGREWDQDLKVICANCHEGETIDQTAQTGHGIYLTLASQALRQSPFSTVGDLSEAVKQLCVNRKVHADAPAIHRAVELVTGNRLTRHERVRQLTASLPDPRNITTQEAHEILTRLGVVSVVKMMSISGHTETEQAAHETRLREQITDEQGAAYRAAHRRRPIQERLAEIFAGKL